MEAYCCATKSIHGRLLSKPCFFCTSQIQISAWYANNHRDCLFKEFINKTRWHFAVTHQFQKIFVPKPMYSCIHCHKHIHFLFYLDSALISATRVDFLFVLSAFFPSLCAEKLCILIKYLPH